MVSCTGGANGSVSGQGGAGGTGGTATGGNVNISGSYGGTGTPISSAAVGVGGSGEILFLEEPAPEVLEIRVVMERMLLRIRDQAVVVGREMT